MNQIAKKYFLYILCLSLFVCSNLLGQTAELITHQFNVENAIRDKVSVTIGAKINIILFALAGIIISLKIYFKASAKV